MQRIIKNRYLLPLVISLLAGFLFAIGREIEVYDTILPTRWGIVALCFVLFSVIILGLFIILDMMLPKIKYRTSSPKLKSTYYYLLMAACFMVVMTIATLGAYPGILGYDAHWQLEMYREWQITGHHPIIHTLFFGFIMDSVEKITGSITKAIFVYVLSQGLVISLLLSYVMTYLYEKGVQRVWRVIVFLFLALFPVNVIMAISVTKDCLFAPAFLVFLVLTYEMLNHEDLFFCNVKRVVLWAFVAFLSMILRNNAIYVLALSLIILFFLLKHKKQYAIVMACLVVALVIYFGPFTKAITVSNLDSREFLSVPSQQIVRVYINHRDELTENERQYIRELFQAETYGDSAFVEYMPRLADPTKGYLNTELVRGNVSSFAKLYFSLLAKYPKDFIESFLINTHGFWYPNASLIMDRSGNKCFLLVHCIDYTNTFSKIPGLYKFLYLFEQSELVVGNKLVNWIFLPGTFFWFFIYFFVVAIRKKEKALIVPAITILLYWMTFLLGPVVLVRYVSFLYLVFPLGLLSLFKMYGDKANLS